MAQIFAFKLDIRNFAISNSFASPSHRGTHSDFRVHARRCRSSLFVSIPLSHRGTASNTRRSLTNGSRQKVSIPFASGNCLQLVYRRVGGGNPMHVSIPFASGKLPPTTNHLSLLVQFLPVSIPFASGELPPTSVQHTDITTFVHGSIYKFSQIIAYRNMGWLCVNLQAHSF